MRGIEKLRDFLKGFPDFYVVIGGTACSILFEELGLSFRATKDVDMVLIAEAFDRDSCACFRDLVRTGGYQKWEKKDGTVCRYRFSNPRDQEFPEIIELFSYVSLEIPNDQIIIPIAAEDGLSDFSAILLDPEVYDFIRNGSAIHDGIRTMEALELIVLKAVAWDDNQRRRGQGSDVKEEDVRKHFRDIARLLQIVPPGKKISLEGKLMASLERLKAYVAKTPGRISLERKEYMMEEMDRNLRSHFL